MASKVVRRKSDLVKSTRAYNNAEPSLLTPKISSENSYISIPTTVIGDWPKPPYLKIPDTHRASKEGRLYVPSEFNRFLNKLHKDSINEYGNRENITPMKIAKKSKPYIEMEADSFKVCVLPADYAEQFNANYDRRRKYGVEHSPVKLHATTSSPDWKDVKMLLATRTPVAAVARKSISRLMFKTPPPVTVNTKKPVPPFILTTSHKDPHPIYRDHYRQGTRGMLPHMASVSYTPHGSTAESPTPLTPSPMTKGTPDKSNGVSNSQSPDPAGELSRDDKSRRSDVDDVDIIKTKDLSLRSLRLPTEFKTTYRSALYHCLNEQISCGVSIATDGFLQRENNVYHFCRHIKGIDFKNLSFRITCAGAVQTYIPMIVGTLEIDAPGFLAAEWAEAQRLSPIPIKACIPGPYTILHSLAISGKAYLSNQSNIVTDLIRVIGIEILLLHMRGCRHVQIDETVLPHLARTASVSQTINMFKNITHCFEKVPWRTANVFANNDKLERVPPLRTYLHMCDRQPGHLNHAQLDTRDNSALGFLLSMADRAGFFAVCIEDVPKLDLKILLLSKRCLIVLGCVDSCSSNMEPVRTLRRRISEALLYVPPERLMISPTCGMGSLNEGIAARKLLNLAIAGRQLRAASFTYYMLQPQTQDSQFDSQWNSSRSKKNLSKLSNDSKKGKKSSATSKAAKKKITKKTVKPKKKASDNSANVNRPTSADTPATHSATSLNLKKKTKGSDLVDNETKSPPRKSSSQQSSTSGNTAGTMTSRSSASKPAYLILQDLIAKFWTFSEMPSESGGVYQMLINMTERLLIATRRTAYTYRQKYRRGGFDKGLKRWKNVGMYNRTLAEKVEYDLSLDTTGQYTHHKAVNCDTSQIDTDTADYPVPFKVSEFYAKCLWMRKIENTRHLRKMEEESKIIARRGTRIIKIPIYTITNTPRYPNRVTKAWQTVKYTMGSSDLSLLSTELDLDNDDYGYPLDSQVKAEAFLDTADDDRKEIELDGTKNSDHTHVIKNKKKRRESREPSSQTSHSKRERSNKSNHKDCHNEKKSSNSLNLPKVPSSQSNWVDLASKDKLRVRKQKNSLSPKNLAEAITSLSRSKRFAGKKLREMRTKYSNHSKATEDSEAYTEHMSLQLWSPPVTMSPASTHNKDESTSLSSSEDEEGVIRLSPQRLAERSSLHADHVLSSKKDKRSSFATDQKTKSQQSKTSKKRSRKRSPKSKDAHSPTAKSPTAEDHSSSFSSEEEELVTKRKEKRSSTIIGSNRSMSLSSNKFKPKMQSRQGSSKNAKAYWKINISKKQDLQNDGLNNGSSSSSSSGSSETGEEDYENVQVTVVGGHTNYSLLMPKGVTDNSTKSPTAQQRRQRKKSQKKKKNKKKKLDHSLSKPQEEKRLELTSIKASGIKIQISDHSSGHTIKPRAPYSAHKSPEEGNSLPAINKEQTVLVNNKAAGETERKPRGIKTLQGVNRRKSADQQDPVKPAKLHDGEVKTSTVGASEYYAAWSGPGNSDETVKSGRGNIKAVHDGKRTQRQRSFETIYAIMNPQSTSTLTESSQKSVATVKVEELNVGDSVNKVYDFKNYSRKAKKVKKSISEEKATKGSEEEISDSNRSDLNIARNQDYAKLSNAEREGKIKTATLDSAKKPVLKKTSSHKWKSSNTSLKEQNSQATLAESTSKSKSKVKKQKNVTSPNTLVGLTTSLSGSKTFAKKTLQKIQRKKTKRSKATTKSSDSDTEQVVQSDSTISIVSFDTAETYENAQVTMVSGKPNYSKIQKAVPNKTNGGEVESQTVQQHQKQTGYMKPPETSMLPDTDANKLPEINDRKGSNTQEVRRVKCPPIESLEDKIPISDHTKQHIHSDLALNNAHILHKDGNSLPIINPDQTALTSQTYQAHDVQSKIRPKAGGKRWEVVRLRAGEITTSSFGASQHSTDWSVPGDTEEAIESEGTKKKGVLGRKSKLPQKSFETIYAMMNPQSTSALNESSKNSTESVKVMELSEAAKVKKIIKFKTHSRKKGKMVKEVTRRSGEKIADFNRSDHQMPSSKDGSKLCAAYKASNDKTAVNVLTTETVDEKSRKASSHWKDLKERYKVYTANVRSSAQISTINTDEQEKSTVSQSPGIFGSPLTAISPVASFEKLSKIRRRTRRKTKCKLPDIKTRIPISKAETISSIDLRNFDSQTKRKSKLKAKHHQQQQ